jgi:CRP-like cAMP-binding protein
MARSNRILEAMSPECRQRVLALARNVELPQRTSLYTADRRVAHVHFLTSGIASEVVTVPDGGTAEIGLLGPESVAGTGSLLGSHLPVSACVMQVGGSALRVSQPEMRRLFLEHEEIRNLLLENAQQQMLSLSQIAACNKLHQAAARLARWLLTAADLLGSNMVALTQESLSQMLGTRRTTIALVAGSLQRSGMIQYRRGMVHIIDRGALERTACDCYQVTRRLSTETAKQA